MVYARARVFSRQKEPDKNVMTIKSGHKNHMYEYTRTWYTPYEVYATIPHMGYLAIGAVMSRAQILFTCSVEFKEFAERSAQQQNMSLSQLIRESVAKNIGYDLSQEKSTDGRRKYSNVRERMDANNAKQKEKRDNVKKLMSILGKEQHLDNIEALTEHLKKRGVDLSDV